MPGDSQTPAAIPNKLTTSDKRGMLVWVLLGIAGALFAHRYFFQAFPEASVDFHVSRTGAVERARAFVGSLGENISGYGQTAVFSVDDEAKVYLERELGLKQANRLMSSELNIWYWDVRFFRPQQEEEFHVRVNPAGQIAGYEHKIEEARTGARLERAAAESLATHFLMDKLGDDDAKWRFLPEEANASMKPNRVDWAFTWEKEGFRAKDAPDRLRVKLHGDRPGAAEEFLQVPEAWKRSYGQLRSTNLFYNQAAIVPYLLFLGMAMTMGIVFMVRGETSWAGALKLGGAVAILLFFMQINNWPLERAGYDTNSSYGAFVASQIASAAVFGLLSALMIALVMPGAEPFYRASQPQRLRLSKAFTLQGLRSKEFLTSAVVGLAMAAAHIGFLVAFYLVASKYGAWAPQELNYENSVNTAFPWIAGVAIGLLASTSEEFLFRLFAIPFLQRVTRSRLLAVIIPAFSWGFLHTGYPQEPPYIRGLEVGLIGIVAGLVMLRWGIVTTLVWHYTVDASLVGLLLIRSGNLYFKISGGIVGAAALAPLLFAGVSYLARGRFETHEDLLNAAVPVKNLGLRGERSPETTDAASGKYEALSKGMIGFLAACLVAGAGLAWKLKPETIGSYLKLSVNAREALKIADETLQKRGVDASSYHRVTLLADATDDEASEFLRERLGTARVNDIYEHTAPGALWRIRYFRDSQPEEFAVIVKPDGSLHSVRHTLAEDAAGATLPKEEAVTRAEKFLREEKKVALEKWTLVESDSKKQPHRTDHTLVWQKNDPLNAALNGERSKGEYAYARIEVQVLGEEVANYRTFIKIPDDWRRKTEEKTLSRIAVSYAIPLLFGGALFLAPLIFLLTRLRTAEARAIPWRKLALLAGTGPLAYLAVFVFGKGMATFLNAYKTEIPLKFMYGGIAIGVLIGAAFYFGTFLLLFGMAWYFARLAFGEERLPDWRTMPGSYYRDAAWIGTGGAAGLMGIEKAVAWVLAHWPTVHRAAEATFGQDFDAKLPSLAIFATALQRSLVLTGVLALIVSFAAAELKPLWLRAIVFAGAAIGVVGSDWGDAADFLKQLVARTILITLLYFGVTRIMRFNVLGGFLAVLVVGLTGGAIELLGQPSEFYRVNGYVTLALLAVALLVPTVAWRARGLSAGA